MYVALDEEGKRKHPVPPLLIETEADRRQLAAAQARQAVRLARRAEALAEGGETGVGTDEGGGPSIGAASKEVGQAF